MFVTGIIIRIVYPAPLKNDVDFDTFTTEGYSNVTGILLNNLQITTTS